MNYTEDSFEWLDNSYNGGVRFNHCNKKRNYPLTLIAAMICQDCVLIGSDSKAEDTIRTYKTSKLFQLLDSKLVWGGASDSRIRDDINNILLKQRGSFDKLVITEENGRFNKDAWAEDVADLLCALNGRSRARAQNSKMPIDASTIGSELLIAGYLGKTPIIVTIEKNGTINYDTECCWSATGSECYRFTGAIQALMPNGVQRLPLNEAIRKFSAALDASIKNSSKADFPVQLWIAYPDKPPEQKLKLEDDNRPTLERLESFLTTLPPSP